MTLTDSTAKHLLAHHRDFEAFAVAMEGHYPGHFDAVYWAFLELYAPENPNQIVDLGTGPGRLLRDLHARYPKSTLVGVDAQPAMLERARQRVAEIPASRIVAHDLAAGPIAGLDAGGTDLVLCSMLLHEMQVPTQLLDEAHRLLCTGGILVLVDWMRFPLSRYAEGVRPHELDSFQHFSEHCRYSAEDLVWLVEQSGFRLRECMTRKSGARVMLAAEKVAGA